MQLIAFLNKLLQLGIHPGDLSFLMVTASDSAIFKRLQKIKKNKKIKNYKIINFNNL